MSVKSHKCKAIESIDCVLIQTLNNRQGWFWHFIESLNTLKEKVECHEIKFRPYCGKDLEG